jgi:hypothetical protein
MAVEKSKLFKGIAWFVAVVIVFSLFMVFAQLMAEKNEFIKTQSLNMVLCVVSGYIAFDIFKKYKVEKKKKQIFGMAFFLLITVAFLIYFGLKIAQ